MNIQNRQQQDQMKGYPLTLPFTALDATMLPLVGGKAANLGELTHAGLPVPGGFCVTTEAYELVSRQASLEAVLNELDATSTGDLTHLEKCAAAARAALLATPVPTALVETIREAYHQFTHGEAVAVRSSATAEDLPFASFAGQQDSYLNVVGMDAVLNAVRHCWASLWTDRAMSYRESHGIDHRTVRLAVVVQRMVDANVAGVLFTAHPLTGRRRQALIDANPGLGEAVVSGAVNPDRFVIDAERLEIIERHLGEKRLLIRTLPGGGTEQVAQVDQSDTSSLTDEQIIALTKLGMQVEAHYGTPQDIEWAIDSSRQLWLTQARPITTLFPLPANTPTTQESLRIYYSMNVAQGMYRPFTPMGISAERLLVSAGATFAGFPPRDLLAGPPFLKEAAYRLFWDITPLLRSTLWCPLFMQWLERMEARSAVIFQRLASDARLTPIPTSRRAVCRRLLTWVVRTHAAPFFYLIQALIDPKALRRRLLRLQEHIQTLSDVPGDASGDERLATLEHSMLKQMSPFISSVLTVIGLAFGLPALAGMLLNGIATEDEQQVVQRSLPYNPTTEMDLHLWQLVQKLQEEPSVIALFRERQPEQITQMYSEGTLPNVLQQGLADFLRVYGHRGVAEIDLGLTRWSENPTYLLGILANYLQLNNPDAAPDVQFRRGAQKAEAMVAELTRRARQRGWLRGKLVAFCLRRIRDLAGLREVPKYCLVLLAAQGRRLLFPIGEELVRTECVETTKDIFFLTIAEVHEALAGKDMRAAVRERRSIYEHEIGRRHIPRILLSNGTEPEAESQPEAGVLPDGILKGAPASAGVVTATACVILDPLGARLQPGEILVAPSTDPGWTPLFLTAGGLVMEMGGPMAHGAIVAREYGIPAVVGVAGATERISTGQQITVDGSNGTITFTHVHSGVEF